MGTSKTNSISAPNKTARRVSIPYRHKQNAYDDESYDDDSYESQSPVGTKKTKLPDKNRAIGCIVSIPYRHIKNRLHISRWTQGNSVSIPYRHKQNIFTYANGIAESF